VNACAALDDSEIERAFWLAQGSAVSEMSNRAAQGVYRIAGAVIAPTMTARSGEVHFKTAAGERLAGDMGDIGAVENQKRPEARRSRSAANVAHAAEIAFTLLADVGHQHGRYGRGFQRRGGVPGGGQSQQRRQTSPVIGNARAKQPSIAR